MLVDGGRPGNSYTRETPTCVSTYQTLSTTRTHLWRHVRIAHFSIHVHTCSGMLPTLKWTLMWWHRRPHCGRDCGVAPIRVFSSELKTGGIVFCTEFESSIRCCSCYCCRHPSVEWGPSLCFSNRDNGIHHIFILCCCDPWNQLYRCIYIFMCVCVCMYGCASKSHVSGLCRQQNPACRCMKKNEEKKRRHCPRISPLDLSSTCVHDTLSYPSVWRAILARTTSNG